MAQVTIPSPRSRRQIKTSGNASLQLQLNKARADGSPIESKTTFSLTAKEKSELSHQLNINRLRENNISVGKKANERPYEQGKFYQGAVDQNVEWAGQYKDVKHGTINKVPRSYMPNNLKDYDKNLKRMWESKDYTLAAKEEFAVYSARQGEKKMRATASDARAEYGKLLDAQYDDLQGKLTGNTFEDVMYSVNQGFEMARAPLEAARGRSEEYGMAMQEASRQAAYHEPTGTMDKYLHLTAQNAVPMGSALASAIVPGIGPILSGGFIASYTGTEAYYDLRRAGVSKETAKTTAVAIGMSVAAVEMATGKVLSKTPVVGKLFEAGGRRARLRNLGGSGRKIGIKKALGHTAAGKMTQVELSDAMAKAFMDTSRLGLIKNIAKNTTAETLTGGVEEWIQQGMQLGLMELAVKHEDLNSILPLNADGSYDVAKILQEMNDAFIAGAVLEGSFGVLGAGGSLRGRWKTARTIEAIKNNVRHSTKKVMNNLKTRQAIPFNGKTEAETQSIIDNLEMEDYFETDLGLTEEGLDFIARRVYLEMMNPPKKKIDKKYKATEEGQIKYETDTFAIHAVIERSNAEKTEPGMKKNTLRLVQLAKKPGSKRGQAVENIEKMLEANPEIRYVFANASDPLVAALKKRWGSDVNVLDHNVFHGHSQSDVEIDVSKRSRKSNLDSAYERAVANSVSALLADPMQAWLIDNSRNVSIEEVIPGKAYTMSDGIGGKIVVMQADGPLLNEAGQQVMSKYRSGTDADTVEVSPELWAKIEKKGLGKDVVLLNHYVGSTMPHESSHVIIQNSPEAVGGALLNFYDKAATLSLEEIQAWKERDADKVALDVSEEGSMYPEEAEWRTQQAKQARINKLEAPSEAIEARAARQGGRVGDIYARLDVAIRGKSASEASKKRHYENQVISSVRTGSKVRTSHLGVASPTDIGPRIGRIGRKTADVAQAGVQAAREGDVGAKARSAGGRIMGIGKKAVNRVANSVSKGTELNQSMPTITFGDKSVFRASSFAPKINANGELVLKMATDTMFESNFIGKGTGISFTDDLNQAQEYGERTGSDYYFYELSEKGWEIASEGKEVLDGQEASSDEFSGERRISYSHAIKIPAGEFSVQRVQYERPSSFGRDFTDKYNLPFKSPEHMRRNITLEEISNMYKDMVAYLVDTLNVPKSEIPSFESEIDSIDDWDSYSTGGLKAIHQKYKKEYDSGISIGIFSQFAEAVRKWKALTETHNLRLKRKGIDAYRRIKKGTATAEDAKWWEFDLVSFSATDKQAAKDRVIRSDKLWGFNGKGTELNQPMPKIEQYDFVREMEDDIERGYDYLESADKLNAEYEASTTLHQREAARKHIGDTLARWAMEGDDNPRSGWARDLLSRWKDRYVDFGQKDNYWDVGATDRMVKYVNYAIAASIIESHEARELSNDMRYLKPFLTEQDIQELVPMTAVSQQKAIPPAPYGSITAGRGVVTQQKYTSKLLRSKPNAAFLFGDNLQGRGKGGQAVIRDEPNAYGIPTKKKPSMSQGSFFSDAEYDSNVQAINAALKKIPSNMPIVLPSGGIGTGLAKLREKAPRTFKYLTQALSRFTDSKAGPKIGGKKSEQAPELKLGKKQAIASETARLAFKANYDKLEQRKDGYVDRYAKDNNLNSLERTELQKFMDGRLQRAINNESVYTAKTATEKRFVNEHKKALTELKQTAELMPGLLKTYMADKNVKARQTRKAGVAKLKRLLKYYRDGKLGQIPFEDFVKQFNAYMQESYARTKKAPKEDSEEFSLFEEAKASEFTVELKRKIDADQEFNGEAAEALERANVEALVAIESAKRKTTGGMSKPYAFMQGDVNTPTRSVETMLARMGPLVSDIERAKHIAQQRGDKQNLNDLGMLSEELSLLSGSNPTQAEVENAIESISEALGRVHNWSPQQILAHKYKSLESKETTSTRGIDQREVVTAVDEDMASRAYATSMASSTDSIRLTGKRVSTATAKDLKGISPEENLRPTAFGVEGQYSQQVYEGVILPLTEQAYIDMGLGYDNRSTIGPEGYVDILRVGSMEFDLDASDLDIDYKDLAVSGKSEMLDPGKDRRIIRQMTEMLGPNWAIQAEANRGGQIDADITRVYTAIKNGLFKKNSRNAMQEIEAAAMHSLFAFAGNELNKKAESKKDRAKRIKRFLPVEGTSAQFADYSTIMADAVCDFFIEMGLVDDKSFVSFQALPGEITFESIEDLLIEEAAATEVSSRVHGSPDIDPEAHATVQTDVGSRSDIRTIINTSLTAQAATRKFAKDLGELLTADLPKADIQHRIGYKVAYQGVASQAMTVSRAMNNLAPVDAKNALMKTAAASRQYTEMTIAELLDNTLNDFLGRTHGKEGAEAVAFENTLGVSSPEVKKLLDILSSGKRRTMANYRFMKEAMGTGDPARPGINKAAKQKTLHALFELQNLLQYGDKAGDEGDIDLLVKGIEQDADLEIVDEAIGRLQKRIDLNMSMKSVSGDEAAKIVAAALTHIDFADQLFGISGMRKLKALIESMKLEKSYLDIFGMKPEYKMRDIIRNVLSGKQDSKPRGVAGEYSRAMRFAADAMNSEKPAETIEAQRTAIQANIDRLTAMDKLTNDENYALAQYHNYLASMDKVAEIVNSEGEYGQKLNSWLKTDYKKMSDAFYDDVVSRSKFAGEKQYLYNAAVFVQKQTEETPEHLMSQITGRMLEKRYDNLVPHLAEGKVLKFDNFLVNALEAQNQSIEALSNQEMIHANLFDKFFTLKPQSGYSVLKPAGSKLYALKIVKDGKIVDRAKDFDSAKEISKKHQGSTIEGEYRDVYAPNEIADYFNKITATSPLRNNKFLMGLMSLNAKLKAIRINFGMFHRRGLLWSAIMAGELNADYKDQVGVMNKMKSRFDYGSRRQAGMDMMMEFSPEMMALNYYGMTLFQVQDIGKENLQNKTRIEKFIAGHKRGETTKIVGKGAKKFEAMTSRLQGELFGIFGSSLKTATAFNELVALQTNNRVQITIEKKASEREYLKTKDKKFIAKHVLANWEVFGQKGDVEFDDFYSAKEEEIYRVVAGLANADFGGMHMGRLGVSKGAQDVMRLLLLGPDWTYSNIISAVKAVPGLKPTGKIDGVGTNRAGTDLERKVYQAFWLRIIGRSLAITTAINLLMAGIDDDSIAERMRKAKGRGKFNILKADISPFIHLMGGDRETDHYLNTLGHFLDPAKIAFDPVRMAYHKSSTVAKPIADLISGTRYDHKRPTTFSKIGQEGLATWKSGKRGPLSHAELPSYATWQAIQLLPIQAKNVFELFGGEENVITGIMKTNLGLDVNRTYKR